MLVAGGAGRADDARRTPTRPRPADGSAVTPEGGDARSASASRSTTPASTNQVRIRSPSTITSNGITISATMNSQHEFAANASSGAGDGDVGIAGSVAINIVNISTTAVIPAA